VVRGLGLVLGLVLVFGLVFGWVGGQCLGKGSGSRVRVGSLTLYNRM
jgi:hypothetical protein